MPISTPKDANRVPALLATLDSDGSTVISILVDPITHRLKISDGTTGSDLSTTNVQRDANRIPAVWGVKSSDTVTPTPIYGNSSGSLLTKSS